MTVRIINVAILSLFFFTSSILAQTAGFNFQGRLNDGSSAANGSFDLQFRLFDSITGGSQIGPTVDRPGLILINGVFSTGLDFGASAFDSGNRFLEIAVRRAGSPNAHVILGARQQILSVPLAVRAASAANADTAAVASLALTANKAILANNASNLGGLPAANFARLNFANAGDFTAFNMITTNYLAVGGNTTQPVASNGMVKAMIEVDGYNGTQTPSITRCYNGVTGASTGNCGFSVVPFGSLSGVYWINFGFPVGSRFFAVTAKYNSAGTTFNNVGANYRLNVDAGPNVLEVFTFVIADPKDTIAADFTVIVF